jgi:hypothetical protein
MQQAITDMLFLFTLSRFGMMNETFIDEWHENIDLLGIT